MSNNIIQFPRVATEKITPTSKNKNVKYGTVVLNASQLSEYQKMLGTDTMKEFGKVMSKGLYKRSNDDDKAEKLQAVITDVNKKVKNKLVKSLNVPLVRKKK
jgi:hypothetical protein